MDTIEDPKPGKKRRLLSTVRQRKKARSANTQRYLPFAEISNDTVFLKNGGLRAVMRVEPINFNLKSETEQQGIIAGYESFINTLAFPVQILARSSRVNIDPYIATIRTQASNNKNPLLREQTDAYANFVERMVEVADIMQKRFFVVIPLDDSPQKKNMWTQFRSWMNVDDNANRALQRNKRFIEQHARLKERIDLVETSLNNIGLATHRLNTLELIQLYYQAFNRDSSQNQKLPLNGAFNTEGSVL